MIFRWNNTSTERKAVCLTDAREWLVRDGYSHNNHSPVDRYSGFDNTGEAFQGSCYFSGLLPILWNVLGWGEGGGVVGGISPFLLTDI